MERYEFINSLLKLGYFLEEVTEFNNFTFWKMVNDCCTMVYVDMETTSIIVDRYIVDTEDKRIKDVDKLYFDIRFIELDGKALFSNINYKSIVLSGGNQWKRLNIEYM